MSANADTSISQSLAGLLLKLRSGDTGAREALIAHAEDRLRQMVHWKLRDFPAGGHHTDVVMGQVVRELRSALANVELRDLNHFLHLSAVIIRRVLIELLNQPQSDEPAATQAPDATVSLPDRGGQGRMGEWREFQTLLEQLPEELREVVDYVHIHGLSLAETAEALGVGEAVIRRRWLEARVRLGESLLRGGGT